MWGGEVGGELAFRGEQAGGRVAGEGGVLANQVALVGIAAVDGDSGPCDRRVGGAGAQRVLESQQSRQHLWADADSLLESSLQVSRRDAGGRRESRDAGAAGAAHQLLHDAIDHAI